MTEKHSSQEPHTTLVTASLRHSASSTQTRTINYSTVMRHHGAFQHVLSELSSWFTEMTQDSCFHQRLHQHRLWSFQSSSRRTASLTRHTTSRTSSQRISAWKSMQPTRHLAGSSQHRRFRESQHVSRLDQRISRKTSALSSAETQERKSLSHSMRSMRSSQRYLRQCRMTCSRRQRHSLQAI